MTADSVSVTVKIADMPAVRAIVAENAEQTAEITRLREELTRLLRTIDEQSYPAAERALKAEADAKRERAAAEWLARNPLTFRAKCWHKPPSDATDATDGWIGVVMHKRCVFPKLYHTTPDSGQEPLFPKEER